MSDLDFDTMSLDELKRLKKDLDRAIANYDDRRKAEARRDLEEKAREYGFSLSELVEAKTAKRGAVPLKYLNPRIRIRFGQDVVGSRLVSGGHRGRDKAGRS